MTITELAIAMFCVVPMLLLPEYYGSYYSR